MGIPSHRSLCGDIREPSALGRMCRGQDGGLGMGSLCIPPVRLEAAVGEQMRKQFEEPRIRQVRIQVVERQAHQRASPDAGNP